MIKIEYPAIKPSLKTEGDKQYIFCINRKRWMSLTPEEWVRQNFLLYLVHVLNYPLSLMAVEKQLLLGELKKRFDIVIYQNAVPFVLVECKEMNVPISEKTLEQAMRYNINLQAGHYVVTNGTSCFAFKKEKDQIVPEKKLPSFTEILP